MGLLRVGCDCKVLEVHISVMLFSCVFNLDMSILHNVSVTFVIHAHLG